MSGDWNTSTTKERKNFVKCCMLIVRSCRGLMFEIVERTIVPSFQELTLEQLQRKYKEEEKEQLPTLICNLFHDLNDMTPVETDFDISSLHFLMKHFCNTIERPTNGWGEKVEVEVEQIHSEAIQKISAGDAIEKILSLRSDILKKYGAKAEIPDGDCDRIKRNIESLIKWLENQYGGRKIQDTLGRINADDTAIMERTTYGTTKRQSNERTTINARKESKMILKQFLKCCETAVDLGDKSIDKRDIENAKEFLKAAGADPQETFRQQEIALRELRKLVEQLKGHVSKANRKIEGLEKENQKLKDEIEKLQNDRTTN